MAKYFDEKKWLKALKKPDWYLELFDDFKKIMAQREKIDEKTSFEIKKELYNFFENQLTTNNVALGLTGPDWDKERKPIDTIIIHHSKNQSGLALTTLNAVHLLKLYASYYANPTYEGEEYIKGQPIYSGHFKDNKQVFYGYHWFVRMDGEVERLLEDKNIGWHAGNWEVNCRSIGICLDNDFIDSSPSDLVISSIVKIIKENYPQIKSQNILGHREVNPKTTCPGNTFLTDWKQKIVQLI